LVGSKNFLFEVIESLSLPSKELELGQDMLRYSNTDRIMVQSGSKSTRVAIDLKTRATLEQQQILSFSIKFILLFLLLFCFDNNYMCFAKILHLAA